jgi:hypothetical protein
VTGVTSSGGYAFALVTSCSTNYFLLNPHRGCSTEHLYESRITSSRWRRLGGTFSNTQFANASFAPAGHGVRITAASGKNYLVNPNGTVTALNLNSSCQPIGSLATGTLAGICNVGGGGNASVVSFAVLSDNGRQWAPLIGGPPASGYGWVGQSITNGVDTIFLIEGGQTLWRTSSTNPGWSPVLQVGGTEELFPLFVSANEGFVLESAGLDAHWFETVDGGLTWSPIPTP